MTKKFYITTTLPYVNAEPHIGFALEIIQADVIARYRILLGDEVIFNFGTDEHGLKIYRKATESKKDPQSYCDEYAAKFDNLKRALNLSYTNFIRTTDPRHVKAAQEFWKKCKGNGYIEKKNYRIKYCVGCELEKTDSELVNGRCPLHPNQDIEIYDEENYFFKFSKFKDKLLEFYGKSPNFVVPESKFNEIKAFIKRDLEDFSISRLKSKMPWGIDVPGDPNHVMYVWFDALVSYISTLGWPENLANFKDFWPGTQVAGKDNLRQQTAIWQAMLMAAGLPNSKQVFIHGFITANGQKISKSLGNVVDPFKLVEKYGTDAVRYYLLREIPAYSDGNFSEPRFKEIYNADLANGLGNLVARVAKLLEVRNIPLDQEYPKDFLPDVASFIETYQFDKALTFIWKWISNLDKYINDREPWRKERLHEFVIWNNIINGVREIAYNLQPFLPETAQKIQKQFAGPKIKTEPPLFPRLRQPRVAKALAVAQTTTGKREFNS